MHRRSPLRVTLLLVVALAGCGFQLQRPATLPLGLKSLRLEADDTQSEFYHALKARLEDAGVDRMLPGRTPPPCASRDGWRAGAERVRATPTSTSELQRARSAGRASASRCWPVSR
jgi:hypothetical protein